MYLAFALTAEGSRQLNISEGPAMRRRAHSGILPGGSEARGECRSRQVDSALDAVLKYG